MEPALEYYLLMMRQAHNQRAVGMTLQSSLEGAGTFALQLFLDSPVGAQPVCSRNVAHMTQSACPLVRKACVINYHYLWQCRYLFSVLFLIIQI